MTDEREGLPSGSEMHRIMACDGYLEAKATWPPMERIDDGSAASGVKIHEAMEYIIDGKQVEMTMTEREEYITDRCNQLQQAISATYLGQGEVQGWKERRWFMTNAAGAKVASTKPDLVQRTAEGVMLITDYKTGPIAVAQAADNWQLATAAACANEDAEVFFGIKKIFGVIIQPLVTLQPKVVEMTPQQVVAIRTQIQRRLEQLKIKGQVRRAGSHCSWCPVAHACPEAQFVGAIIAKKFNDLGYLSPPQLVELIKIVPYIRKRCDDVSDYIKAILTAKPDAIPGLELQEVGSGHDVPDVRKFIGAVAPHLDKNQVASMLEVPVSKARKAYMDAVQKATGCNQKEARAVWDDRVVQSMVERPKRILIKESKPEPKQVTA